MALFGKKKLSKEEILKAIAALTDEEKAEVIAGLKTEEQASNPTATDEEQAGEEVATQNEEDAAAPSESVEESENENATEEVTEEVAEEVADEGKEDDEPVTEETEQTEEVVEGQPETPIPDEVDKENGEDVLSKIVERVSALEQAFSKFEELQARMTEYTKKQAEQFGYTGGVPGAKKDFKEMSAGELAKELATEI